MHLYLNCGSIPTRQKQFCVSVVAVDGKSELESGVKVICSLAPQGLLFVTGMFVPQPVTPRSGSAHQDCLWRQVQSKYLLKFCGNELKRGLGLQRCLQTSSPFFPLHLRSSSEVLGDEDVNKDRTLPLKQLII